MRTLPALALTASLLAPSAALAQAAFVTEATWWSHCSARLSLAAAGAASSAEAALLRDLGQRAFERARASKNRFESDDRLAGFAENMRRSLQKKMVDDPSVAEALAQEVERCRSQLEKKPG